MKTIVYTNGDISVIKTSEEVPYSNFGHDAPPYMRIEEIAKVEVRLSRDGHDGYTVKTKEGHTFSLNEENYLKARTYFLP